MKAGRILALDFGRARVGLAITDERRVIAQPIGHLKNDGRFFKTLKEKLKAYEPIALIVLGNPLELSGRAGVMSREVLAFKEKLERELGLEVALFDERLTSQQADRVLREGALSRKERASKSDEVAAALILQGYLGLNP